MYEELDVDDLDADLKMYIETHTYLDCKNPVKYFFKIFPQRYK